MATCIQCDTHTHAHIFEYVLLNNHGNLLYIATGYIIQKEARILKMKLHYNF